MSDVPAEAPPAWNATERSRAQTQTRALLMALSRQHSLLGRSPTLMALIAVPTVGLAPLLILGRMIERWHRLEWTLLSQFGRWMETYQDRIAGDYCAATADAWRATRPFTVRPWLLAAIAVPIVVATAVALFLDHSEFGRILGIVASLAICQGFGNAEDGARSGFEMLRRWTEKLNHHFAATGMRVVDIPPRRHGLLLLAYAAALCLAFSGMALWPWGLIVIPLIAAVSFRAWNQRLAATRLVHLQLIERLLEWMDDTGLPVEYEVTALNPDEIAAMMR